MFYNAAEDDKHYWLAEDVQFKGSATGELSHDNGYKQLRRLLVPRLQHVASRPIYTWAALLWIRLNKTFVLRQ